MAKRKPETLSESELLYDLLWKKHNAVDISKVFYTNPLQDGSYDVKLGGKKIKENELANLRSEASIIQQTQLWKIMLETLKNTAHQHLFTQMKTLDDAHWGKAILYALSIEETIIKGLENAHVNVPVQARTSYAQRGG